MKPISVSSSWGTLPLVMGGKRPKAHPIDGRASRAVVILSLLAAASSEGCSAKGDKQTYDPVALGMMSTDTPFYDDGETEIFQVKRAISLPVRMPTAGDLAALSQTAISPYARAPWISRDDLKVQVSWTVSNLDAKAHNVEVLLDPWSEFARYVPGVNVGEESTVPDLSGIDLFIRVDALSRQSGIFTYDDMDELATDLATVQKILADNPAATTPAMEADADYGAGVNGMINHTFELHNRSNDDDKLIKPYRPPSGRRSYRFRFRAASL